MKYKARQNHPGHFVVGIKMSEKIQVHFASQFIQDRSSYQIPETEVLAKVLESTRVEEVVDNP